MMFGSINVQQLAPRHIINPMCVVEIYFEKSYST